MIHTYDKHDIQFLMPEDIEALKERRRVGTEKRKKEGIVCVYVRMYVHLFSFNLMLGSLFIPGLASLVHAV